MFQRNMRKINTKLDENRTLLNQVHKTSLKTLSEWINFTNLCIQ